MFIRDWSLKDMESMMFHEYIHARQHQVEGIILPRDEQGKIIEKEYTVHVTQYEVEDAWDTFYTILDVTGVPKEASQRNTLQEQQYQMYKTTYVDQIVNDYNNRVTKIKPYNRELVLMELEAYSRQLDEYNTQMSAKCQEETAKAIRKYTDIWNEIKNQ